MKKRLVSLGKQAAIVSLSVIVFSGVGYVFAQPTVAPGSGAGVALPINTGGDSQTKSGALTVSGELASSTRVSAPEICIAGDCQTSWPSGGVSIQSGSGVNVGNWIQTNGGGGSSGCPTYNVYYSNGNTMYSGAGGHCGNASPISVSITAPGQVISTSNEQLRCVWTYGQYSYYTTSFVFSNNGSSEPYYTPATNVNVNVSGSTITLTGECPINYSYYYIRPAASANYLYQ